MKKILAILLIIFPIYVSADTINVDCQHNQNNASILCNVTGKTTSSIVAISAKVSTSNSLEYVSFVPGSGLLGDGANGEIELYTDIGKKDTFSIGTINLKTLKEENLNFKIYNIIFYDESDQEIKVKEVNQNLELTKLTKIDSTPAITLNDIVIEEYDLPFDMNKDTYTLEIGDETKLNITPFIADENVSYEIKGNEKLTDGSVVTIVLTTDNGLTKEYNIKIKKQTNKKNFTLYLGIIGACFLIIMVTLFIIKRKSKDVSYDKERSEREQ